MNHDEYIKSVELKIVQLAKQIVEEKVNLVSGCRDLLVLRLEVGNPSIFLPIVGIESECDHFLIGDERKDYSDSFLEKNDAELADFSESVKGIVFAACKEIIEWFS